MYCPKCGNNVFGSVKYCTNCGFVFSDRKEKLITSEIDNRHNMRFIRYFNIIMSYKYLLFLLIVCLISLCMNWISLTGLNNFEDLSQSGTNDLSNIVFDFNIPIFTLDFWIVTFDVIENDIGTDSFQSIMQGLVLCALLFCIAWVCAICYCFISIIKTIISKQVISKYTYGAFGWTSIMAVSTLVVSCFVNAFVSSLYLFNNGNQYDLFPALHVSLTPWVWISLFASLCGFWLLSIHRKEKFNSNDFCINTPNAYEFEHFVCPLCGETVLKEEHFCVGCGLDLADLDLEHQSFCWNCNCIVGIEEATCHYCGASLAPSLCHKDA